ncbi:MAG: hypothetical protein R6V28_07645 [Nitriliruptoraceae bacterium]
MRGSLLVLLVTAVVAAVTAGCADAGQQVSRPREQPPEGTDELTGRARFCLAVTRATTAIESGSPATAREAAEEVLAQVPDELATEARGMLDELQRVLADDDTDLRDPQLQEAAQRLRERARQRC